MLCFLFGLSIFKCRSSLSPYAHLLGPVGLLQNKPKWAALSSNSFTWICLRSQQKQNIIPEKGLLKGANKSSEVRKTRVVLLGIPVYFDTIRKTSKMTSHSFCTGSAAKYTRHRFLHQVTLLFSWFIFSSNDQTSES